MNNSNMIVTPDGVNTRLVYTLRENEQVMKFTNGMLSNNNIKGIPGYSIQAEQNTRRLIYNIPASMSLATLMKQNLTKNAVIAVLRNIADVIQRAEDYMLNISSLYLDIDYVFVDLRTLSVYLICIPTNVQCTTTFKELIRSMFLNGVIDLSEDATYPQRINNYLNMNNTIVPSELKRFLDTIGSGRMQPGSPVQGVPPIHSAVSAAPAAQNQRAPQQMQQPQPAVPQKNPAAAPKPQAPAPAPSDSDKTRKVSKLFHGKDNAREKASPQPSQAVPSGFGGMAIPGVDPISAMKSAQPAPEQKPARQPNAVPTLKKQPAPTPVQRQAPQMPQSPQIPQPQQRQAAANSQCYAVLVDKMGVRHEIKSMLFWIGRSRQSETKNDLIIQNPGVGKNHAYITVNKKKFYLTDNNSQNGTYVNGRRVPGGAAVELHNGDRIAFWNEEYMFSGT